MNANARRSRTGKQTPTPISEYLASIGSKGGKATGASKRRGDAAYYKRISKKAAQALGRLARGAPKNYSAAEIGRRSKILAGINARKRAKAKKRGADWTV